MIGVYFLAQQGFRSSTIVSLVFLAHFTPSLFTVDSFREGEKAKQENIVRVAGI
jgi:hypothetical protein